MSFKDWLAGKITDLVDSENKRRQQQLTEALKGLTSANDVASEAEMAGIKNPVVFYDDIQYDVATQAEKAGVKNPVVFYDDIKGAVQGKPRWAIKSSASVGETKEESCLFPPISDETKVALAAQGKEVEQVSCSVAESIEFQGACETLGSLFGDRDVEELEKCKAKLLEVVYSINNEMELERVLEVVNKFHESKRPEVAKEIPEKAYFRRSE